MPRLSWMRQETSAMHVVPSCPINFAIPAGVARLPLRARTHFDANFAFVRTELFSELVSRLVALRRDRLKLVSQSVLALEVALVWWAAFRYWLISGLEQHRLMIL